MTSPDLSPLLAAAKMRDTAVLSSRPRPERQASRALRILQRNRSVRTRETFPPTSKARTRTV